MMRTSYLSVAWLFLPIILSDGATAQAAVKETASAHGATATAPRTNAGYYAVTLMTSFSPVSATALAAEFPDHVVYQKKSLVFGKEVYLVRLGFFPTFAAAEAMKNKLAGRYPGAWSTKAMEAEQHIARGEGPGRIPDVRSSPDVPATPVPAPAPARTPRSGTQVTSGVYAIQLDSATSRNRLRRLPMPVELKGYQIYEQPDTVKGKIRYDLRLGFFPSRADAEQARSFLTRSYPASAVLQVPGQEKKGVATAETAVISPPPRAPASLSKVEAPAVVNEERPPGGSETQAAQLLGQGREHITSGEYRQAIRVLNRLLALPRNRFTDDALEYLGVTHERRGQLSLARTMYETYLRTTEDAQGAQRVRQRLASMTGAPVSTASDRRPLKGESVPVRTVYGGLSQTYYHGTSTVGIFSPAAAELSTDTQRSLITYLDLNARYQGGDFDNRVVIRNRYSYSWLDGVSTDNRLSAAYLEFKDKRRDISARFGRQPGHHGGILGIFDGATATYHLKPTWRVTGSTGEPQEVNVDARRYFYSLSTDLGPFARHWYGGFYYLYQFVEGVEDRNAVGMEARYLEPGRSVYTLFDYDLGFKVVNIAMLQANWQTRSNTHYSLLLDHRRSPALQTANVLIGLTAPKSYSGLSLIYTAEQLRAMAGRHTPQSNYFDFSVSHALSPRLQWGAGINMYSISEATETAVAQSVPASGDIYSYSVRAIGTQLFRNDISVLTLSHSDGKTLQGNSIALTNKSVFQNKWTVDVGLRLSRQSIASVLTGAESEENLVLASLRMGYRLKQSTQLEAEYAQDRVRSRVSASAEETVSTTRRYSVGYRWTF